MRSQTYEILSAKFIEPLAVKTHLGFLCVEDTEDLLLVGLRILANLGTAERRPGCRAAGGIANHPGEIADQEDHRVPEVLKMFQLA